MLHSPANGAEAYIFHGEWYILINIQLGDIFLTLSNSLEWGNRPLKGRRPAEPTEE